MGASETQSRCIVSKVCTDTLLTLRTCRHQCYSSVTRVNLKMEIGTCRSTVRVVWVIYGTAAYPPDGKVIRPHLWRNSSQVVTIKCMGPERFTLLPALDRIAHRLYQAPRSGAGEHRGRKCTRVLFAPFSPQKPALVRSLSISRRAKAAFSICRPACDQVRNGYCCCWSRSG